MKENFRSYEPNQPFLLPPDIKKWLPPNHLVFFMLDLVNQLDLSSIYGRYTSKKGKPPYNPKMMTALIFYAYSTGVFSSRKIERHCVESIPFRVLTANQFPDHDTIAHFRKLHLGSLAGLFSQVFQLARESGLVKLGNVSLDGTKVKANASRHKAMSYKRMNEEIVRLEVEIDELLEQAELADLSESEWDSKQDWSVPEELAIREKRLARIKAAKVELESRYKSDSDDNDDDAGGSSSSSCDVEVPDKAQINFTDPDSRIMPVNGGKNFEQGYNCQCLVDSDNQIVIDASVTQDVNDKKQLLPAIKSLKDLSLLDEVKNLSADAGYCSEANLTQLKSQTKDCRMKSYISTGRKLPEGKVARGRPPSELSEVERMKRALKTKAGRKIYSMRKFIVEPVFGQIKSSLGFDRFSFKGLGNVANEWTLVTTVHNILKIYRNRMIKA